MNLVLYVHDLFSEIGHAKAMIETFNSFPANSIKSLKIVCYTHGDLTKIFPRLHTNVTVHKVPLPALKPFILKVIFFHIYTLIYTIIFALPSEKRISIGIASIVADVVNVQFVHHQWSKLFFQIKKLSPLQYVYKKLLFTYLNLVEKFVYRNNKVTLICLSQFIKNYLSEQLQIPNSRMAVAYSSVNTQSFDLPDKSKKQIIDEILQIHPQLKGLDLNSPIALFVGAYERKGLPTVLRCLPAHQQLIIVGKSDSMGEYKFPQYLKIFRIEHTTMLKNIYALAHCFLFPTHYEPFGLVILEAVQMGLDVYVTEENVGASEILHNIPGVYLYKRAEDFPRIFPTVISQEIKRARIQQRKQILAKYSWEETAKCFERLLI